MARAQAFLIEHVLTQGALAVDRYLETCKQFGFDIVEVSSGLFRRTN